MIVILTEKPSAAKNFAAALGGTSGTYQQQAYKIVSARGHLLKLAQPADQVSKEKLEQYKFWKLENIPWRLEDIKWKKQLINGSGPVIKSISNDLKSADEVVIATDVDPTGEGELLAWEILNYCRWSGKTTRMYFVDEAPKSIQKAFQERRVIPSMQKDGDYIKADTRSKWDFLSMQFTRIATCIARECNYQQVLRQGRLKSVMVYLTGEQLKAIAEYKKKPFYEARFQDENGNIYARKESEDIREKNKQDVHIEQFVLSEIIVDSKTRKKTSPGKLLDLAALSSILATKGFRPKEILDTYQKMYEAQIVSYPRTEDKMVTPEQFMELLPFVDQIAKVVNVNSSLLTHRSPRKTHVKEGGSHGANRPGIHVPDSLDSLQTYGKAAPAIYELVAKNYLAMLAEDYEYLQEKGHLTRYPEFTSTANIPVKAGFREIFDSSELLQDDAKKRSAKPLGETAKPFIYEGANPKPQRPTMKWLRKKLEKYNVGTGATRVSTLAEITSSKDPNALMTEKKGVLGLTECGELSYKLLEGCKIASAEVTERLFQDMQQIGEFKLEPNLVLQEIDELLLHDMEQMKQNKSKIGTGTAAPREEKMEGIYQPTGKLVRFKQTWGGYRFSEDECARLLAGETIEITCAGKKGPYKVKGALGEGSYKGHKYWGFQKEV